MSKLNEVQIRNLSRDYAEVKAEHKHLLSMLPKYDWTSYAATVKAEGDVIVIVCMGHQWEANPRFVSYGDKGVLEYAFYEKIHDEFVLAACLFMDRIGGLHKKSVVKTGIGYSTREGGLASDPLIEEILAQAIASDTFKPT